MTDPEMLTRCQRSLMIERCDTYNRTARQYGQPERPMPVFEDVQTDRLRLDQSDR